MVSPITDVACVRNVNGFNITGRIVSVAALQVGDAQVSIEDFQYRNTTAKQVKNVEAYLDIQYAHQPIGNRRFKPAEMRDPWEDYDASKYRVISLQGYSEEGGPLATREEWGLEDPFSPATWKGREGEDCLRIHVMIPTGSMPVGGWPCVVHFHGGGGNYLSAANHSIRALRLCAMGVAVVAVEYRVGVMSHIYHPDMEGEIDYNGVNLGLTDMIAALGWINTWGSAFNINTSNITTLGSSYGGNAILVMLLDAYARSLFQRAWVSSPSGGFNQRWSKQPYRYTNGYERFYDQNHDIVRTMSTRFKDGLNDKRLFSDAITDKGFWLAYRENLGINNLLSVGNGHTHRDGTYHSTDALPMMMDGVYINHRNNREAAVALAYPGTHNVIITVGQQESSAIGFGLNPYPWERDLQDVANCNMAEWRASPIVDKNYDGSASSPVWSNEEVNRQIFNMGYQHSVLWVARAISNAGADAYLLWNNCPNELKSTRFSGHAGDIPFLTGNSQWSVGEGFLTRQDIYLTEWFMRMLVNFAYSGDPNVDSGYTDQMSTFVPKHPGVLTKFNSTDQNWNLLGSANRSAESTTTTVTNNVDFASHVWDWLDTQKGFIAP